MTKIALNCVTEVTCVTGIRPDEGISAYNDGKLNFPWPTENLTFAPRMRMLRWRPSPFNCDLDITNILVVSPQVRYIEIFDIRTLHLTNKFGRSPATSLNRGSTVMPVGLTSSCRGAASPRSCTLDCTLVFACGNKCGACVWYAHVWHLRVLACVCKA